MSSVKISGDKYSYIIDKCYSDLILVHESIKPYLRSCFGDNVWFQIQNDRNGTKFVESLKKQVSFDQLVAALKKERKYGLVNKLYELAGEKYEYEKIDNDISKSIKTLIQQKKHKINSIIELIENYLIDIDKQDLKLLSKDEFSGCFPNNKRIDAEFYYDFVILKLR